MALHGSSTIFLLDTGNEEMNRPLCGSGASIATTTRLDAAKRTLLEWTSSATRQTLHSQSHASVSVYTGTGRIDRATSLEHEHSISLQALHQRVRHLEPPTGNSNSMDYCQLVCQAAADLKANTVGSTITNTGPTTIVLMTATQRELVLHLPSILEAIDQIRAVQDCRLHVVGFGFSSSNGTDTTIRQVDENVEEEDNESGNDQAESDEEEKVLLPSDGIVRYRDKGEQELLLVSLVEKTGGSVTAASNFLQLQQLGNHLFPPIVSLQQIQQAPILESLRSKKRSRREETATLSDSIVSLPETLSIVSFNVAEFVPSHEAPNKWDPVPHFRAEILRCKPDVVCLQEVTAANKEFLLKQGFVCLQTTPSHCGLVTLHVKREWLPVTRIVLCRRVPAVLAAVTFTTSTTADDNSIAITTREIYFGSAHFSPFGSGAQARLQEIETVLACIGPGSTLILGGDFNMRQAEDRGYEQLGLLDAWKESGWDWGCKMTWDSRKNHYHGPNAFPFHCRFDRIYFSGDELSAQDFGLIANEPATTCPGHYLSDHFGMRAVFRTHKDTTNGLLKGDTGSTSIHSVLL